MNYLWVYLSLLEVFITSSSLIVTKFLTTTNIDVKLTIALTYIVVGFNSILYILYNKKENFKIISSNISKFIIVLILISAFLRTFGSVIIAKALEIAPNISYCHLIVNTNVILTLIASYFIFKQQINLHAFMGIIITLIGMFIVIINSN